MERIYSSELPKNIGKIALLKGWLHLIRNHGSICFLILRDKNGLCQIVIDSDDLKQKIQHLQNGSIIQVEGEVKKAPTELGCELYCQKLEIIQQIENVPPIDITKKELSLNLDTLFNTRVVSLRHPKQQAIFSLLSLLQKHIRDFYIKNNFVEISTPKIIATPTEGGSEVFRINYFEKEACLAQSPQFYKQMMVGVFEKVFEIGRVFRAEQSHTSRHMTEILMLDMEIGFIENLDQLLSLSEEFLIYVVSEIWKDGENQLNLLNSSKPVLSTKFPKISLQELHEIFKKETGIDHTGERDASPDEEKFICEYAKEKWHCEAVFITHFPWSDAKFYHKRSTTDNKYAERADLIFRGVEIATIPLREENYEKLISQIKEKGINPNDDGFTHYLEAFKYGLPPHGGFGLGISRLLQKIIGLENVKEAELFPRDPNRLTP
ncbi:aspartate--tRNA(Asn) ligase [Candidatus Peregrinibacteria bacterium]|nr:aspartate--tRNA(Asn) ligase [Candidatus Peregrinibacteria bacterium]